MLWNYIMRLCLLYLVHLIFYTSTRVHTEIYIHIHTHTRAHTRAHTRTRASARKKAHYDFVIIFKKNSDILTKIKFIQF